MGAELGHSEEEDQGGDEECPAANADEAGDGSYDEAEGDASEHGRWGHWAGPLWTNCEWSNDGAQVMEIPCGLLGLISGLKESLAGESDVVLCKSGCGE